MSETLGEPFFCWIPRSIFRAAVLPGASTSGFPPKPFLSFLVVSGPVVSLLERPGSGREGGVKASEADQRKAQLPGGLGLDASFSPDTMEPLKGNDTVVLSP